MVDYSKYIYLYVVVIANEEITLKWTSDDILSYFRHIEMRLFQSLHPGFFTKW